MDKKSKDLARAQYIEKIFNFMSASEDVGMITSGTFNFPIVGADGSDGWIEVVVKVPNDEGDEGYDKRTEYDLHLKEQTAKKAEALAKKQAKIEADKAKRAEKAKAKAEAESEGK